MPDTVSTVCKIRIRPVCTIQLTPSLQFQFNFLSADTKKRTNISSFVLVTAYRPNTAHAVNPASPRHLKQKCLCIIFHMMCQRDPAPRKLCSLLAKDFISQQPRGLLFSDPLCPGILRDMNRIGHTFYSLLPAKVFHKLCVTHALFSTDSMFYVHNTERKIQAAG